MNSGLAVTGVVLFYAGVVAPFDTWIRAILWSGSLFFFYLASSPKLKSNRFVPIENEDFDLIAYKMEVQNVLPKDKQRRYFRVSRNLSSIATHSNALVFGDRVYSALTPTQRVALAAHEFAHIKRKDLAHKFRRYQLPSVGLWIVFLVTSYAIFRTLSVVGVCLFVGLPIALTILPMLIELLDAERLREVELRCDEEAASYIDGSELIGALRIADSIMSSAAKRNPFRKLFARLYPTLDERSKTLSSAGG